MKIWKIIFWALIFLIIALGFFLSIALKKAGAATNISNNQLEHFAWNDVIGWFDFFSSVTVNVTDSKLTGYVTSDVGDVSLDCTTTRNGNVCTTSNYFVSNSGGTLSGYAWNDTIGWVSFCGNATVASTWDGSKWICPANPTYNVIIDGGSGDFYNYAWNDVVGWISFNCTNPGVCGASTYKVKTIWGASNTTGYLTSSVFDTQQTPGAILNSIIWEGQRPNGTCVKFQIAVSDNSNGPWIFYGPGQDSNNYFGADCPIPGIIKITGADRIWVNNKRYLRYKVILESDQPPTQTPIVENIILNWSR